MLTFFRRIRKGLLDGGRTSKYLIYAIGEIVLVVIGILIALQVNNWNMQQIEKSEEKNYLIRLVQDLNHDLLEIDEVVTVNQRRLYQCRNTLISLGGTIVARAYQDLEERIIELGVDTTSILNQTFGVGLNAIRFYFNYDNSDATYQELLANGKIDIVQDEQLKIAIVTYYTSLEDRLQLPRMAEMMRNRYVEILAEHGISMLNNMSYEEIESLLLNKNHIIAEIENIAYITGISQNVFKYDNNSIERRTKELIAKIEDYLN